jgi:hypothetical protein
MCCELEVVIFAIYLLIPYSLYEKYAFSRIFRRFSSSAWAATRCLWRFKDFILCLNAFTMHSGNVCSCGGLRGWGVGQISPFFESFKQIRYRDGVIWQFIARLAILIGSNSIWLHFPLSSSSITVIFVKLRNIFGDGSIVQNNFRPMRAKNFSSM